MAPLTLYRKILLVCNRQRIEYILSSSQPYEERYLISRIADGDIAAFETLFSEMHASLCLMANRLLHDEDLAKDLVADIFLRLWENRHGLGEVRNIQAYLYTSTRNRCLDQLKKVKHIVDQELTALQQPGEHFLQVIYDAETIRLLDKAIMTLPPECRKVVELGLEGLSTNEIAEKLSVSASAVSNQKNRAARLLKEQLPAGMAALLFSLLQ